jgi:RNA recognition motif-containing protein
MLSMLKTIREFAVCLKPHNLLAIKLLCRLTLLVDYSVALSVLVIFQEGRMRGQAFVTFPSVELAQRALVSDYQLFL